MSDNTVHPFSWGKINLNETVHIENIPHVTRRAVGEWLEYADPQKAIDKILERNSYIDNHSVTVNLTGTDGKNYDTKVYHPIGFLLLVFESGQPKAQAMKQAVAEFVWHFAGPQRLSHKQCMEMDTQLMRWVKMRDEARTTWQADIAHQRVESFALSLGIPVPPRDAAFQSLKQATLAIEGGES